MITAIDKLLQSLNKIRSIAESGHHIATDELSKIQFEEIIRELGRYEEWKEKQQNEQE